MSLPTPFLSSIPFLVSWLPGYLSGDWWVESRSLSYILAHRFSVRDESHRLSRSFILGGIPKDTSIRFQRELSQSYLFTAFSTSLQSQTRASPFLSLPCSPTSPSEVSQSKVPSSVLYSESLEDLFDIEQGGIIVCPSKNRDVVIKCLSGLQNFSPTVESPRA